MIETKKVRAEWRTLDNGVAGSVIGTLCDEIDELRRQVAAQAADHIKCMGAVVDGRKFGNDEKEANQRILQRATPFGTPLGTLTVGPLGQVFIPVDGGLVSTILGPDCQERGCSFDAEYQTDEGHRLCRNHARGFQAEGVEVVPFVRRGRR